MPGRRVFEVTLCAGAWVVKENGGYMHATWHISQRLDAVADGITIANLSRPSLLLIRNAEGVVETERLYGD